MRDLLPTGNLLRLIVCEKLDSQNLTRNPATITMVAWSTLPSALAEFRDAILPRICLSQPRIRIV